MAYDNPFELPSQRAARGRQQQMATNATDASRNAQQFSQPQGGNFQPEFPNVGAPEPPGRRLAGALAQQRTPSGSSAFTPAGLRPSATPPVSSPTYQTYNGSQPVYAAYAPPQATTPSTGEPTGPVREGAGPRRGVTGTSEPGVYQGPAAPAAPTQNQWGNSANLDPTFIRQQVMAAFQRRGGPAPTEQEIQYWVNKALTPDIYSDNQVRVGWNPYWEDRLITGADSSDPRFAGNEGLIADPYAYGLNPIVSNGQYPAWYDAARAAALGQSQTTTPMPGLGNPAPTPTPTPAPVPQTPYVGAGSGVPLPFGPGTTADFMAGAGGGGLMAADFIPAMSNPEPPIGPNAIPSPITGPMTEPTFINSPYTTPVGPMRTDPGAAATSTAPGAPGPGWVQVNGGWVPPDHPLAGAAGAGGGGGTAPSGNPGDSDYDRARQILEDYLANISPDTAGMKEQQKEAALAADAAARERAMMNAAASGTSTSGTLAAADRDLADQLAGTITGSYRDIDQWGQQTTQQNRMAGARALQNLGSAQSSSGLNWEQLRQQNAQFYAQLEQSGAQAAAQMGLNWAQLGQQDRQFLMDLELRRIMAEQNANQWLFNTLLGGA